MATRKNRRQKKRKGGMRKSLKVGGSIITDFNEYMQAKICVYVCYKYEKFSIRESYNNYQPIIKIKNIIEQNDKTIVPIDTDGSEGKTINTTFEQTENFKNFSEKFTKLKNKFNGKNKIEPILDDLKLPYVILHGVFHKKPNAPTITPDGILKKMIFSLDGNQNKVNTAIEISKTNLIDNSTPEHATKGTPDDFLIDFDVPYADVDENKSAEIVWIYWHNDGYVINPKDGTGNNITDQSILNKIHGFWGIKVENASKINRYYNFDGILIGSNASPPKLVN